MLRRSGLALICVCCCWLAGCHVAKPPQSAPNAGPATGAQAKSADTIDLFLAFVQLSLGDPFFNRDLPEADAGQVHVAQQPCLWTSTDHHLVSIEQQNVLDDNGYRIGQVVGCMPARLMSLLDSRQTCIDPRHRTLAIGEPAVLPLGPVLQRGSFQVKHGGQSQQFTLDQARFCLEVAASLTRDGRTKLEFTPRVEHRSSTLAVDIAPDLSGLVNKLAPPHRSFPLLGWQVVLKPGETLVIGANLERPGSLGCHSFVQEDAVEPVQRVLVLRTSRPLEEP